MLACILLMYAYKKLSYLHIIPESIVAVIIGSIFGGIIKWYSYNEDLINILSFEPHAFFLLLLPPIMYDAGFTLNKANFFANIVPIASYAVMGTIISSVIFSLTIFFPGYYYDLYPLSFGECLQFGSLISAVDPVATISIFKNVGINNNIYFLVFGESIMNDAVSIALNHSFAVLTGAEFSGGQVISMFLNFLLIFFGSIIFGLVVGIIVSLILKNIPFDNDQFIELSFFFFFSYIPYIISEAIGLSGILSILTTGMVMGHYAKYSLSPISRVTAEVILKLIASTAEIFIFAYLGLSFPLISVKTPPVLVLIGSFGLLFSRAIAIFGISLIINLISGEKIKFSSQIIVWFSGLRGAVAFYLAINTTSENQDLILSSSLWLILISIIVLGSFTPVLLKFLDKIFPYDRILQSEQENEEEPLTPSLSVDSNGSEESVVIGEVPFRRAISESEQLVSKFNYLDIKFFRGFMRKRLWEKYEKGFKDINEYNR
jgi:sodium/hydrogen exchanger 8